MFVRICILLSITVIFAVNGDRLLAWFSHTNDSSYCSVSDKDDDEALNTIQVLQGSVMVVDPIAKKKSNPSRNQLTFQRKDCKKCLYTTSSDLDGKYEVHLVRGTYRLIVRYGTQIGKTIDGVAEDQPRFIEVNSPTRYTTFDIKLIRPDGLLNDSDAD